MKFAAPEQKGISSRNIKKFVERLEQKGLSTHNLIISVDDTIVYENYWAPFDKDFLHRMYSVSKSITAIAVGFAEQDGLLNLDDPMEKYFADELKNQKDENMRRQTVRNMLMMSTAKLERNWFTSGTDDRVRFYFENDHTVSRPGGTLFQYDSASSFVLCALVERLTGKKMMDYLREKVFDKIGVSGGAYCLECPGGHSWGDSGVMFTARDLWLMTRFAMNCGNWNGEQILNEKYMRDATSKLIDNSLAGISDCVSMGYGYYIWKCYDDAFMFFGMGSQYGLCYPDKKLIMVYNGDNQGKDFAKPIIIDGFHHLIKETMSETPLAEDAEGNAELAEYSKDLKLAVSRGNCTSECAHEVDGKWFVMRENPMNIEKFRVCFNGAEGVFEYYKYGKLMKISFGMCKNVAGNFPEEGYSDMVGTKFAPGNFYKCMASASWIEERKIDIKVHITDKYFAQLNIVVGFKEDGTAGIYMRKTAENFLDGYDGYAGAVSEK